MSDGALNAVSNATAYSVPAVYAPTPVMLNTALQSGPNGFAASNVFDAQTHFAAEASQFAPQTFTTDATASFAEVMASGDSSGQMAGFVSYLNQGPPMYAESGSGGKSNLSSLFPW